MRENKREVARYSDKEFLLAPKTDMLARRETKEEEGREGRTEGRSEMGRDHRNPAGVSKI